MATWTNVAVSYIRFSSLRQQQGDSLRRQTEGAAALCLRHGLILDTSYSFRDLGVSGFSKDGSKLGKNATKGDLAAFLGAVKEGKIPKGITLVLEKLDRLSRAQPMQQLALIDMILKSDVRIATTNPDRFYTDEDVSANPYVIYEILSHAMSGYETSAKTSYRLTQSWQTKRAAAVGGRVMTKWGAPWLTPREDRQGWEEVPDRVAVIRRIFELADGGASSPKITRALNGDAVPCFSWSIPKPWAPWQVSYVTKLLGDRRVIGEHQAYRYEGGTKVKVYEVLPNYYPPVIDPDQFARVQAGKAVRRNKQGRQEKEHINIFRGLLFDAKSGNTFGCLTAAVRAGKADGKYVYRRKSRLIVRAVHDAGFGVPVGTSFVYDVMETAFLKFVTDLNPADFSATGSKQALTLATLSSSMTLVTEKIWDVQQADPRDYRNYRGAQSPTHLDRSGERPREDQAAVRRMQDHQRFARGHHGCGHSDLDWSVNIFARTGRATGENPGATAATGGFGLGAGVRRRGVSLRDRPGGL